FPYNKGGEFKKWYGNREHVINWENNGHDIHVNNNLPFSHQGAPLRGKRFQFQESITWSFISSAYFGVRYSPPGSMFDVAGSSVFSTDSTLLKSLVAVLCSKLSEQYLNILNPTLNFQVGNIANLPILKKIDHEHLSRLSDQCIAISKSDFDEIESSWDFRKSPLINAKESVKLSFKKYNEHAEEQTKKLFALEEEINSYIYDSYEIDSRFRHDISLKEITLFSNIYFKFSGNRYMFQSDQFVDLVSYTIGCMMGRYSLDQEGLVYAHSGNKGFSDLVDQGTYKTFPADDDGIIPLTQLEWFPDDATNRFKEFVEVVWGKDHLQENLDFVAESLCLHAIKPKKGEAAIDTIRRYLSEQFFKDHLKIYKKRPIYWLFSSGKTKAFECLVYLHRYNESTLSRIRTAYVIPLLTKMDAYAEKLSQDRDASESAAEIKRLEKELAQLQKQQAELSSFDEKLRHYADQRISLDLDDGVKVNYGKFGDLLANVKDVTGKKPEVIKDI
ncbi:MAG TPA: BREX-1 system adenine-specific DNA-methyltransferase PglX, partial [Gammaproteobacteria bacterium]|nr:BREX-1 system adenine-specific DNA-methyltransferase PglX [Gammaproteobacteria bacterium]